MESIPQRAYNMSDAELAQFVTTLCGFLTRDVADLAAFGITAPQIAALQALQNVFEVFPTDVQLAAMVTQATQAKGTKRGQIEKIVSYIRVRAANVFGERSGFYKEFGFPGLARMSDKECIISSRMIAITAEKYLTQLAAKGQEQSEIDDLKDKCDEMEVLLTAKAAADGNRTDKAVTRVEKGNEMYGIASEYCDYGQSFYADKNPAKYQDYVIYGGSGAPQTPPDAPTGVTVDAVTGLVQWLAVLYATTYRVEIKSPAVGGSWIEAHPGLVSALEFLLPVQTVAYMIRVFAHNIAGFSPASDEITVNFGLAAPGGFAYTPGMFTWILVAGISHYEMEASYDGGGSWNQIFDGVFTVGEYGWSPPPGMFRIRSRSGAESSAWVTITVA